MVFLNATWYYIHYFFEYIYARILLKIRTDDYFMTDEKYAHIKKCANMAYQNEAFFVYNEYENSEQFIKDMDCARKGQIYVMTGDTWYLILIRHMTHLIGYDFASSTGKCNDMLKILKTVISMFEGKKMKMICRETTSYPLFKLFEKMKKCKITYDRTEIIENETHHIITVKIFKRKKTKRLKS